MDRGELPGDASTLIYLAKADVFEAAARCVGVILVPPAVWRESVEDGERLGYPDAAKIRRAEERSQLRRVHLSSRQEAAAATIADTHRLGLGESEVLALARAGGMALVDEGRASRVARALGIVAVSTLFLPILGLRQRRLDEGAAGELLRKLAIVTGVRADVLVALEERLRKERQ
jgi:predicted nucleic acid-binding protein